MGASGAVAILCGKEAKAKKEAGEDVKAFLAEKEDEYTEKFANPYEAASYGYIDDVIEPRNTRFPHLPWFGSARYQAPELAC